MSEYTDRAHGVEAEGVFTDRLVILADALNLSILQIHGLGTLIGSMDPEVSVVGADLAGVARLLDSIADQGRQALTTVER